jgi:Kef-type K+ transport system membrane component KefB
MEILETITLVLIVAFVLGEVARRLGFPSVIGQIIGGIVLGLPFLSHIVIGDEVAGIVV